VKNWNGDNFLELNLVVSDPTKHAYVQNVNLLIKLGGKVLVHPESGMRSEAEPYTEKLTSSKNL